MLGGSVSVAAAAVGARLPLFAAARERVEAVLPRPCAPAMAVAAAHHVLFQVHEPFLGVVYVA